MKKQDEDPLAKLMKLTKLMKQEKVTVAPKGPGKGANKWRSQAPKFAPKIEKSVDVVEAGGMQVDPSRKEEYDKWREEKLEEQNYRRSVARRKAEAEREAAKKAAAAAKEPPSSAE